MKTVFAVFVGAATFWVMLNIVVPLGLSLGLPPTTYGQMTAGLAGVVGALAYRIIRLEKRVQELSSKD